MSSAQPGTREIAHGLAEALRPALGPGAPLISIIAACDVARLMGFTGLGAALAELVRHARAPLPWPVDVEHVAGRIARMVETAERDGDLMAFHHADRELAALAAQLAATEWSKPAAANARGLATIAADEAFAGLAIVASADAMKTRLTLMVASAVRAAIDWLGADECPRVPLEVHDTALTLCVTATNAGGVGPAGAVLAAVEGSLGREPDGRWTIRVATAAERSSYLLLRQGRYGVALPWHAVARLRMFATHELERREEPRLAPLSTGIATAGSLPAALVALGLTRAWFVADRVVWRMAARAEEADVPGPFSGATRVIEVESGERYWVLEPAWLLRAIAPPDVPPPSPRPRASAPMLEALPVLPAPAPDEPSVPPHPPAVAPTLEALPVLPAPSPGEPSVPPHPLTAAPTLEAPPELAAPAPEEPPTGAGGESLADTVERVLARLRLERTAGAAPQASHVPPAGVPAAAAAPVAATPVTDQPDLATARAIEVVPVTATEPPARAGFAVAAPQPSQAPSPSELAVRVPPRRALIADDSLVARIFLGRLLEQRGWIVESVADAASLWGELNRGPWALVCADIAMPDAQGAGHVTRLLEFLGRHAASTTCIVLTRDGADDRIARDAGASLVLRKPFEAERLDLLLPG